MFSNSFNRLTAFVASAALVSVLALPSPALARNDTLKKLLLLGVAAIVVKTVIDNQHRISPTLPITNPGLTRAEIADLQLALRRAGFYAGSVDGIWGNQTKQALLVWQRDNGYRATGILTDVQFDRLKHPGGTFSTSGGYISTTPLPDRNYYGAASLTRSQLIGLQSDLQFLGYYSGGVDGVWGQHSQAALESYRLNERSNQNFDLRAQPGALDIASVAISARQLEDDISRDLDQRLARTGY